MSDPYIGQITLFAGNFAPRGWAFCDGQLLDIASNSALFSILGTTYGGDGRTTFALPDLRGRVAIHPGTGPGLRSYNLGQEGGNETHTLTVGQMPRHKHTLGAATGATTGTIRALQTRLVASFNEIDFAMGETGNDEDFDLIQPYACVNYIIALVGIFPPRT
jgi:microcystin-dependent protein